MTPKSSALVIRLPDKLAAKAREEHVLAVWDEDDLVTDVYCCWTECGDGYVVMDRVNIFTMDDYAVIQDRVTEARGKRVTSDSAAIISRTLANAAATRARLPGRTKAIKPEDPRLVAGHGKRIEEV